MVCPEYPETCEEDSWCHGSDTEEKSDPILQQIQVRPSIQTETTTDGDRNGNTITHMIPWSPAKLHKLQDKFSRCRGVSDEICLVNLPLTSRGRIVLEEEAEGYRGALIYF